LGAFGVRVKIGKIAPIKEGLQSRLENALGVDHVLQTLGGGPLFGRRRAK
jgi:hypothetical protein